MSREQLSVVGCQLSEGGRTEVDYRCLRELAGLEAGSGNPRRLVKISGGSCPQSVISCQLPAVVSQFLVRRRKITFSGAMASALMAAKLSLFALLLFFGMPCLAQDLARVQTTLDLKQKIWVGQQVTLVVELLSPGYFSGSPAFDLPSVAGVLIFQPDERPVLGSETIGGAHFTSQRHELTIFPQRAGRITIPSFPVRFATRQGIAAPVEERLQTDAVSFEANLPPGAEGLATLISARQLKATETWNPKPGAAKAGDAFTRTITFSASDVPAMAFPPFPTTEIDGLGVYLKAPKLMDQNERGVTRGERQDSLTYVCKRPGHFVVPAARFTWWDLDHQQLRTVDFPARTFEVAANPLSVPAAAATGGEENWQKHIRILGLVTALIVVLGGFGWWTRKHWPKWWRVVDFWRPVRLAPLNPKGNQE
jgi:hypothetical protein